MPLPPGLNGYMQARQQQNQEQMQQLQAIQGLLGIQGSMEDRAMKQQMMPLQLQQLQATVDRARQNSELLKSVMGPLTSGAPGAPGAAPGAPGVPGGGAAPGISGGPPGGGLPRQIQAMLLSGDKGMEAYAKAYLEQNKPIAAREGAPVINPSTGEVIFFAPKLEPGMVPNYQNGKLSGVSNAPGYIPSMTERATAQERVKAGFDLVNTPPLSPNSPPTQGSRLQALEGAGAIPSGWQQLLTNPSPFDQTFAAAAQQAGVDPQDLKRLAITESSLNPQAVNRKDGNGGSFGLMQINGQHAARFGMPIQNLMDPQTNIFIGAQLWKQALDQAGGDKEKAVQIYKGAVSPQGQQRVAGATGFVTGRPAGMSPAQEAQVAGLRESAIDTAKANTKFVSDLNKVSMTNPQKIAKFERVGQLLNQYEGGKLSAAGMDLAKLGNSLGIKIDSKLPNKEAAEALSKEIALELRSTAEGGGMPGAMSDADREFLRSMTPQVASTAEGRKQIIQSRVAVWKREMQVAEMARQYRKKYGQLDDDFHSQLAGWAERNPVFGKQ